MRVLRLKAFARWARREGLTDMSLRVAVQEMRHGLVDAKSERDDVADKQLRALRELARAYLGYSEETIDVLAAAGEVVEVDDGESQAS
jgi:hypothetical protein